MLSETLSDQFEFVKKYSLMHGYAIFKSQFIKEACSIKRVVAKACLCLFMIAISPFLTGGIDSANNLIASANNLPDANGVASAEMKSSAPIEARVGEQQSNRAASRQLEPLMLFALGTMLLSIGAAIKLAGTRNHR